MLLKALRSWTHHSQSETSPDPTHPQPTQTGSYLSALGDVDQQEWAEHPGPAEGVVA